MISFSKNQLSCPTSRFFKSDFGIALIIAIFWKVSMLAFGYFFDIQLNHVTPSLLHHTIGWDGNWYQIIINDHYSTNGASAVFYPLFPLLVGMIHTISFETLDILVAGQVVSMVSIWFLTAALLTIGKIFFKDTRKWIVALVLTAPAAFFLHVFYSEALFMAIGFWAYVFALQRRWLWMGILLAALTAVRLPSLLFIGLCGLEFMRAYQWNIKQVWNRYLLYFTLAPVGFIAYGIYLSIINGDFFGMFHAYQVTNEWAYQVFDINSIKTIMRIVYEILRALVGERPFDNDIIINHLLPVASLLILGVCSLYLLLKRKTNNRYIPLGIFGLASIVMFTLNSNVVSVHRYILPCLTIYIALLAFTKGMYQNIVLLCLCIAGLVLQLVLFALFISNVFVG